MFSFFRGPGFFVPHFFGGLLPAVDILCLLYTSDAADERSSVDLGGRRIIKKKKNDYARGGRDLI